MKKAIWVAVLECRGFYGPGVHVDGICQGSVTSRRRCGASPRKNRALPMRAVLGRLMVVGKGPGVAIGEFDENEPRAGPAWL